MFILKKSYIKICFITLFLIFIIFISFNNIKMFFINNSINFDINAVPYISTYYIEPIVSTNTDVIIDFYITDYYHNSYMNDEFNENFTIIAKIEGHEDKIFKNIKAGDNSINLGKFNTEGEVNFSLLCIDNYGRKSHELFNSFLIQNEQNIKEYIMTENDLFKYNIKINDSYESRKYIDIGNITVCEDTDVTPVLEILQNESNKTTPESNSYICFIPTNPADKIDSPQTPGDYWYKQCIVKYSSDYDKEKVMTESRNTKNGLQQLLNDKKLEGYTKVILLNGTYRITGYNDDFSDTDPIIIPSGLIVDLNQSTIKLNQFTGDKASMFELSNTYDSHLINGTLEGDYYTHDYINSPNNSEWVNAVGIKSGSRYSTIENLIIKDITGYGIYNTIGSPLINGLTNETGQSGIQLEKFKEPGDIDISTGLNIASNSRVRTNDFIDISDWLPIGYLCYMQYLSYGGTFNDTWNCNYYFYDENKEFIEAITGYQYRWTKIPQNSKYMKLVSYNTESLSGMLITFDHPINCSYKNITLDNIRCVGIAPQDMNNFLIEDCTFIKAGQTSARAAIDLEDGWERMQDCTLRNLTFKDCPTTDIIAFAGENIIIDNIDGNLTLGSRVHSYTVKNCKKLKRTTLGYSDLLNTGYVRFNNLTINGGLSVTAGDTSNFKINDCTIMGSTNGGENVEYINCNISDTSLYSSDDYRNILYSATYTNCNIHDKNNSGYFTKNINSTFNNCIFENFISPLSGKVTFNNCTFKNFNPNIYTDSQNFDGRGVVDCIINVTNSTFKDCTLTIPELCYGATINIENSTIINSRNCFLKVINYGLKFPITLKNNTFNINSKDGIVNVYEDKKHDLTNYKITGGKNTESITFESNKVKLTNNIEILTGVVSDTLYSINIIKNDNIIK